MAIEYVDILGFTEISGEAEKTYLSARMRRRETEHRIDTQEYPVAPMRVE
jgi:hypothetical protein